MATARPGIGRRLLRLGVVIAGVIAGIGGVGLLVILPSYGSLAIQWLVLLHIFCVVGCQSLAGRAS